MMFQSYALFPHMTVSKNVAYGLAREGLAQAEIAPQGRRGAGDGRADWPGGTPAEPAVRRPAAAGRAGPRDREAAAAAAARRAAVGAGPQGPRADAAGAQAAQHEVGITFVVVTHDQEEAMSMADRIAVMDDGRVQQVAAPRGALPAAGQPVRRRVHRPEQRLRGGAAAPVGSPSPARDCRDTGDGALPGGAARGRRRLGPRSRQWWGAHRRVLETQFSRRHVTIVAVASDGSRRCPASRCS